LSKNKNYCHVEEGGKDKFNYVPNSITHQEEVWEMEVQLHAFLTLVSDEIHAAVISVPCNEAG
jgi:hypothetical protein